MEISKMKNTIILKNLPSNIIDEAIVFLKTNKKIKTFENIENNKTLKNSKNSNQSKEYIIKEAESVITNYISDIAEEKKIKIKNIEKLENKYKKLRHIVMIMIGIIVFYTIAIMSSL